MGKFVISESIEGFRFTLENFQGEIMGLSPFYKDRTECQFNLKRVQEMAPSAKVEDISQKIHEKLPFPKYVIFKDNNDMYRFNLEVTGGETILTSSAYTSLSHCLDTIAKIRYLIKGVYKQ